MLTLSYTKEQAPTITDNVVIEQRESIAEIDRYIKQMLPQLKSLNYFIEEVFDAKEAFLLLDEDLPNSLFRSEKESFINDIVRLCEFFFKRTISKNIKLRLEVVKTDMCRFFHTDNYRQRLLCTYKGPGTEWLDHSNVKREGLGKGCNNNIVKDFSKVNKANTFDVLLLKGTKYEGANSAIVHRSPPIRKEAKTRILLKIDECD